MVLNDKIKSFVETHRTADVHQLLFSKPKELTPDELKLAIQQIDGLQRSAKKLPTWHANPDIIYPVHLSLEQCSSEETARLKSELVQGDAMVDLTGGFGVDTAFLATRFNKAVHIERDSDLSQIAEHNFRALGMDNVTCHAMDAVTYLSGADNLDLIFIDPARRDSHGEKTVSIADCTPNLLELQKLFRQKSKGALIKLSPMLDLTQAIRDLDDVVAVYVVSVRNECKEVLLKTDYVSVQSDRLDVHCINLLPNNSKEVFTFDFNKGVVDINYASSVGAYLYEPNGSILKAGAFNRLTQAFNIAKLHPNSHLYSSDEYIAHFPGRIVKVSKVYGFDKRSLKQLKSDVSQANVIIRNFPSSVPELIKRLKIKEGGVDYIYATTLSDESKLLIKGTRCK